MKKPKFIPEFDDIPADRQKMPELSLDEREGNFEEVELGLTEEMVLKEASRCLSCRRCIGCGLCLAECDQQAVVYEETHEDLAVEADAIILTSDGKPFNPDRKRDLGYADCANVVTSFELERLMNPAGPFGGYLVRPFDGDIPERIAFIQCVGSREEAIGANYCSTVCCSRTFSQAIQAKERLGDLKVTVFHRGLRPTGKRSELDLEALRAAGWIDFVETAVSGVKEDPGTGTVTVTHSAGGEEAQDEFDLVVLAVGIQGKRDFRRLARAGGLKPNKFGFIAMNIGELVAQQDGVSFAGPITGPKSAEDSVVAVEAAVSRSFGTSAAGSTGSQKGKAAGKGKPIVFACEYGLALAGKNGSSLQVDGVFPFLCYKAGRSAMAKKLDGAGGLVVVGCHRGSHEGLFDRVLRLAPGRVRILGAEELKGPVEEAVSSAVKDLEKGQDATRAPAKPRPVAIVGGGTSGLAAASELLRRGVKVELIERAQEVGKSLMDAAIDTGAEIESVEGFIKSITDSPDANLLLSSNIVSVDQADGGIKLKVKGPDGDRTLQVGALLLATGAESYDADEYGAENGTAVLNQLDFRTRITQGEAPWKKIVMVQCVGARDSEHPYCSRFCCRQALSNAVRYKTDHPDSEIIILHKGIRVFGFEEDLLTDAIDLGIEFVEVEGRPTLKAEGAKSQAKGPARADAKTPVKAPVVTAASAGGESIRLKCDLVVLSLAHSHGKAQEDLSRMTGIPLDDLNFLSTGKALADPFVTPVEGIFACGFARRPLAPEDAFVEGIGAAGAICSTLGIEPREVCH
jgi:heterodisulfide reductase subunit A-like polyferredoxin